MQLLRLKRQSTAFELFKITGNKGTYMNQSNNKYIEEGLILFKEG